MTPDMKPVERDNMTQMDASVAIEFVVIHLLLNITVVCYVIKKKDML